MKAVYCNRTFLRLLSECYFHPTRNEKFPSPKMKRMALYAMLLLWNKHVIILLGKVYCKRKIRSIIIEQMMPEHLDNAVNFFIHSEELTTVNHLAELIFACIIYGNTVIDIQIERSFGGAA